MSDTEKELLVLDSNYCNYLTVNKQLQYECANKLVLVV